MPVKWNSDSLLCIANVRYYYTISQVQTLKFHSRSLESIIICLACHVIFVIYTQINICIDEFVSVSKIKEFCFQFSSRNSSVTSKPEKQFQAKVVVYFHRRSFSIRRQVYTFTEQLPDLFDSFKIYLILLSHYNLRQKEFRSVEFVQVHTVLGIIGKWQELSCGELTYWKRP